MYGLPKALSASYSGLLSFLSYSLIHGYFLTWLCVYIPAVSTVVDFHYSINLFTPTPPAMAIGPMRGYVIKKKKKKKKKSLHPAGLRALVPPPVLTHLLTSNLIAPHLQIQGCV